jgi:hypothetical protein
MPVRTNERKKGKKKKRNKKTSIEVTTRHNFEILFERRSETDHHLIELGGK